MLTFKERQEAERKAAIHRLHLEIDYHLMMLHEAMEMNNDRDIRAQKSLLKQKKEELEKFNVTFRSRRM